MVTRRIVTGHSAQSKAVFASDTQIAAATVRGFPGLEFLRLWGADQLPNFPDSGSAFSYKSYFPPLGGFRFLILTFPPSQARRLTAEERADAYVDLERVAPGLGAHMEPNNPGMHTSDTIDFGYVISGSIWLELDDGVQKELHAEDTFVQNGTRHAWRNKSSEPCKILVVVIGAHREPSGVSLVRAHR
jgi:mannose-6-phosphate isomerase-like protein (cupin superfamily)